MSFITRTICFAFFIIPSCIFGQTSLIYPSVPTRFHDSYLLPNGTIRIVGSLDTVPHRLFFVDRLTDGSLTEPVFFPDSIGPETYYVVTYVEGIVQDLKNGSFILGINRVDCDISPPSDLGLFSPIGELVWGRNLYELGIYDDIHSIIQVDSSTFSVIHHSDTIFLTHDGWLTQPNPGFVMYDQLEFTEDGYIGVLDSVIYRIDNNFIKLDSTLLDNEILKITTLGDTLILASTLNNVYLLDKNLFVLFSFPIIHSPNLFTASSEWIWSANTMLGEIIQWDYQFVPQDTFKLQENLQLKTMIATDDKIILGGNYAGALHSSIFLHETDVDTFEFKISQDISLLNVSLQVPVFYDFVPAWPWGFKISYSNVRATMVNTGNDIIQSVTLHYKEPSTCTCGGFDQHEWKFEAINLAPGAEIDLKLGDFDIACIGTSPSMFCLTVLPGDEYLETNTSNNQFCKSVQSFYVSNTEPNQSQFYIYPNPTSDLIRIEMENSFSAVAYVSIYDLHGRMVKRFTLEQSVSDVAVNDLQAGIYFLYLSIQGQPDQCSKFIVTR